MATEVTDVPDKRRYEVRADGEVAGYAEYILTDDLITFTHTEIDPAFEGRGMGSVLVREALDDVRGRELAVLPLCPFVKGWIERHRDYADLVYRSPDE
ncbi:GNAT family N-acetyltransferase [Nocardiopsis terrae]